MTDDAIPSRPDTRRSFLKKGAVTSGALLLGVSGTGTVAAQNGGGTGLMYSDEFHSEAQFEVISPVLEQNPEIDTAQDVFNEYNSRRIRYLNTDQEVYLFPTQDAEIEQGTVYRLTDSFSIFEGGELLEIEFDPVNEDDIFDIGDVQILDGGGQALVATENFDSGALLRITSEVVEWSPQQNVQGSDIFADYNTRHAQYLNTNDQFTIYTAQDAQIEQGGVYRITDQFEITDAEGNLMTVELERVDEEGLNI